jgi:uncharacterized protein YfaS (alpha-2-macroglobulin family)
MRAQTLALLFPLLLLGCPSEEGAGKDGKEDGAPPAEDDQGFVAVPATEDEAKGPAFRLKEGSSPNAAWKAVTPAEAKDPGKEATQALLKRLPKLKAAHTASFAKRKGPPPPKLTGDTISKVFPPPPGPPKVKAVSGPLKVLRFQPEGDVPLAPHISLTFSQPMVAVGSVGDLAKGPFPATLTPQPPGRWRWLGTRTLLFEPEGERFPMATEYQVEVPAGTKAAGGGALAEPVKWTFRTPTPRVLSHSPNGGPTVHDPTFTVRFDQRVKPSAVLEAVHVTAGGDEVALRLATDEERKKIGMTDSPRALVFHAAKPLPGDASIRVRVGPNIPSAEGPRTGPGTRTYEFRTFGPLKVVRHTSGWGNNCPPGAPFNVWFNNPLDAKAFSEKLFTLEPKIPGLRVSNYGNHIQIMGRTRANTSYKATISAKLRDRFEQTLGKDHTLTFKTTAPTPQVQGVGQNLLVLDPAGKPQVGVRSIAVKRLRVVVYKVDPVTDWLRYGHWRNRLGSKRPAPAPGQLVASKTVDVEGSQEEWVETSIDLSKALMKGVGHAVIHVEPIDWPHKNWRPKIIMWIQATQLGIDTQSDSTEVVTWVTRLKDGAPVGGAKLQLIPADGSDRGPAIAATTDDAGLARLALGRRRRLIVASLGGDSVLLPGYWGKSVPSVGLRWFTFDDRHLYRPKESVQVKGWVRRHDHREGGKVMPLGSPPHGGYRVMDGHGTEIAKGKVTFDDLGAFNLSFTIPDTAHVGQGRVYFSAGYQHMFRIAEFRRPEFEVRASVPTAGPHFASTSVTLRTKASYFAGGALPGAPVNWTIAARPGFFTPPNRGAFAFGKYVPWWARPMHRLGGMGRHGRGGGWGMPAALHTQAFTAKTDAAGKHHLEVALAPSSTPISITANVTVHDVNRQAWSGSTAFLVHPADVYVGLRMLKPYVSQGEDLALDALVVDLDGKAVAGHEVALTFDRMTWKQKQGSYVQVIAARKKETLTSTQAAVRVSLPKPKGGLYRITATVADAKGRTNRTTTTLWVAGGKAPSTRRVQEERVTLIPDKETYGHGDTAKVLVIAPFTPAEGLLTLRRSGVIKTVRFRMTSSTKVLEVAIDDALVPNVIAHVALVGNAPRADAKNVKRPAFAAGQIVLKVPPTRRTLTLSVTPTHKELTPGSKTSVDMIVRDHEGQPVRNAQVALAVVDEAILSLAGHKKPDPLAVFYAPRPPGVQDSRVRTYLRLQAPQASAEKLRGASLGAMQEESAGDPSDDGARKPSESPAPPGRRMRASKGGRQGGGGGSQPPIAMRTDLRALAVFAPKVRTDAEGKARVEYALPDSLTRYRLIAVAAAGENSFGAEEATITARLPLMVRPSPPRFLNFGDVCEMPIVIQNQTDESLEVTIALRASNLDFTAGQGRTLRIPARDRREVRFPAAARKAGTARVQVAVSSGTFVDAQEFSFPVWTPATSEAFATYGVLDGPQAAMGQPVAPPMDAWPEFGGLEITTSSTGLQALTDAVIYLTNYPYGCAEQVSSRVIALAAVRDVLQAFKAEGLPSPQALERSMKRDLLRLSKLQNSDGGWGFWRNGERSWPYLSIHAAHALHRAGQKGYKPSANTVKRALGYLKTVRRHIPKWYSARSRRAIMAYSFYVRHRLGDADVRGAVRILEEKGIAGLSFESLGWIYPLLRRASDAGARDHAQKIRRFLANRVSETAGAAHFVTRYTDGAHVLLSSNRRADGVLLEALLDDPKEAMGDLVPKLVQGLLAHRKRGRWSNTNENAFILLAFDRYFRTAEKVTPDYVARAWLGDDFAGEHAFRGRTTERAHVDVPMTWLQKSKDAQLTIAKDGPGRLYYRIGLRYAPRDLNLPALDAGFTVERRYEAVDKKNDVKRDADGTWRIKAGARVRVRLTMLAPTRRYHVALVDPLPAGLEPLDPALATTGPLPSDPGNSSARGRMSCWWWSRTWYEHSGLRDERAEAFTSLLWEGVHTFTYVTRATTPGRFVAPPAKAEEMYAPETFGRSSTDKVVVK